MIYPTRSAVLAAAAGVPFTLAVAAIMPERWYAGMAWPVAVLLLTLVDSLPRSATATRSWRHRPASVGESVEAVARHPRGPPSRKAEIAVAANP